MNVVLGIIFALIIGFFVLVCIAVTQLSGRISREEELRRFEQEHIETK